MNIVDFLFVELWPWWLGGVAIGLLVPLMYFFLNTALGVSTGYGNLVKIIAPKIKLNWFNSEKFENRFNWRFIFIVGMVIGAFLSARTSGRPFLTLKMGLLTTDSGWPFLAVALWLFAGGGLLGLGARIADGCTSGHSIHGLATLQKSSLVATAFFLLFGVIATYIIKLLAFGGI
jgi:uncharacterized membrane protein YedE/YeeE